MRCLKAVFSAMGNALSHGKWCPVASEEVFVQSFKCPGPQQRNSCAADTPVSAAPWPVQIFEDHRLTPAHAILTTRLTVDQKKLVYLICMLQQAGFYSPTLSPSFVNPWLLDIRGSAGWL